MTNETLPEMLDRHARELSELVDRMSRKAYEDGQFDRMRIKHFAPRQREILVMARSIADGYGVSFSELVSRNRSRDKTLINARRECWVKARDAGYSLSEIGGFFNRDHTTIRHGIIQHKAQEETAE